MRPRCAPACSCGICRSCPPRMTRPFWQDKGEPCEAQTEKRLAYQALHFLVSECSVVLSFDSFEERGGEIALRTIRKDPDDGLAGKLLLPGQAYRSGRGGTGGDTHQYPFLPRQAPCELKRLCAVHLLDAVHHREVEGVGNE